MDMRGTASLIKRFWTDQSGATSPENVIILLIIVVALASAAVLLDGLEILAKSDF
jgi:Flp pilus assembly pilin Flp